MRQGTFHYDIHARCTIAQAIALIADVPRLASMHPLAVATRDLPARPGVVRSTAVTDRLPLGPVHFTITYRADVLSVSATEVLIVAHQKPHTTLRSHARVQSRADGQVHIGVDIVFNAPTLLFRYGFGKARYAHEGLAREIKKTLDASEGAAGGPRGRGGC